MYEDVSESCVVSDAEQCINLQKSLRNKQLEDLNKFF